MPFIECVCSLSSLSPLSCLISLCYISFLCVSRRQRHQAALRADPGAGSTPLVWSSYLKLQFESKWQVAWSCSHGSLLFSLPLPLLDWTQEQPYAALSPSRGLFHLNSVFFLSVFPLCFQSPCCLAGWPALQIWEESTLQASQQMAVRTYVRWSPLQHESRSAKRAVVTVQQIQVVTAVVGGRSKRLFREVLHVCLWWFLAAALKCSVCWVTTGTWTPPVSTVKQMSRIRRRTSGSAHASDDDIDTFTYVYLCMSWLLDTLVAAGK